MRALACGLLLLAGCEQEKKDFPLNPGGGTGGKGGGGEGVDASVVDGNGEVTARVCLVTDLRVPTLGCQSAGAGGLEVTLGTRTAITQADGRFQIAVPTGSNLLWRVRGTNLVPSVAAFSPDLIVPAIEVDDYQTLLGAQQAFVAANQGSLVVRVVNADGTGAAGAVAGSVPAPAFGPFYDTVDPVSWDFGQGQATEANAVAWLPGIPVGGTVLDVVGANGAAPDSVHLVEDQAITFATIEVP